MKISRNSSSPSSSWLSKSFSGFQTIQWSLAIASFLWLLTVVKVFIIDSPDSLFGSTSKTATQYDVGNKISSNENSNLVLSITNNPQVSTSQNIQHVVSAADKTLATKDKEFIQIPSKNLNSPSNRASDVNLKSNNNIAAATKPNVQNANTPPIAEKDNIEKKVTAPSDMAINTAYQSSKKAYDLAWPSVKEDGSVPEEDGYDILPLTELKVPRFWEPSPNVDLNKEGSLVNGQETIFLMLASYRDFQCRETITSAFQRADHPERLFVAAVDQLIPGDIGCLDVEVPCSQNPEQPLCKYRSQIAVFKMDAQFATGPVTARHIGDRMYRGQYFAMQLDAHCLFVRHWDTKIVDQWKQTKNEMAVLSTYLTDVQGSISSSGDSNRHTRPIMCNSDFEGAMPARYLRHGSQPEDEPAIKDMPQLQPFWAAGFSFSRGHFVVRVPYDGYQPMVFQGEEIAIGIRGFTHGYDFYAPRDSVVFHEYAERSSRRNKVHMFWENSQRHMGEGQKSLRRATSIIGMAPDIDPNTWNHMEIDKYGLGKVRTLELFYKLFLIDTTKRSATQLCPFVKSGIMHRDFQKLLKSDHNGIDYSKLENYDTRTKISEELKRQIPQAEKMLRSGIAHKSKPELEYALFFADRLSMSSENPELYSQAKQALDSLRIAK